MSTADQIEQKCAALQQMLLEKNAAYGDSALQPTELFVKGLTPVQRMGVRMDDKISRLQRGSEYPGDDTLWDLAGYLILMLIARDEQETGVEKLRRVNDKIRHETAQERLAAALEQVDEGGPRVVEPGEPEVTVAWRDPQPLGEAVLEMNSVASRLADSQWPPDGMKRGRCAIAFLTKHAAHEWLSREQVERLWCPGA